MVVFGNFYKGHLGRKSNKNNIYKSQYLHIFPTKNQIFLRKVKQVWGGVYVGTSWAHITPFGGQSWVTKHDQSPAPSSYLIMKAH
jgi:hypothetical protein